VNNSSGLAVIKATPEEDRIKKFVLSGMENLTVLIKDIISNMMKFRYNQKSIIEFKSELIGMYFYYARPKIEHVLAGLSKEDKNKKSYQELYDIDYYMSNPDKMSLEKAIYYANKMRELFEDLGIFKIETATIQ
jgi:hypothetical protein